MSHEPPPGGERRKDIVIADRELRRRVRLVQNIEAAGHLTWSPDGRWLAATFSEASRPGIWVINVDTGAKDLLLPGSRLSDIAWLSDWRLVATRAASFGPAVTGGAFVTNRILPSELP
jgi:hypothetical protein